MNKLDALKKRGGDEPTVTNQQRSDWSGYVDWLEKKGLKGHPDLDKGDIGKQVLQQYIKENPQTSLTPDIVAPIQADFANYRNFALEQVKQGKMAMTHGTTPENFMQELSKLDNYPGSMTTLHKFPIEYLRYLDEKGKTLKTVNMGYATTQR